MKARTKAQKIAAKRGRPKGSIDESIIYRESNGRRHRSVEAPAKLATEMRARKLGIPVKDAADPIVGTFIGYLRKLGPRDGLSEQQYQALERYRELRNNWLKSKQMPGAQYDFTSGTLDEADPEALERHAEWCDSIHKAHTKAWNAMVEAQMHERTENLYAALDYCIIRGEHHHHMVSATRVLGNVLSRHFGT
jgi:hypothetical protein